MRSDRSACNRGWKERKKTIKKHTKTPVGKKNGGEKRNERNKTKQKQRNKNTEKTKQNKKRKNKQQT